MLNSSVYDSEVLNLDLGEKKWNYKKLQEIVQAAVKFCGGGRGAGGEGWSKDQ